MTFFNAEQSEKKSTHPSIEWARWYSDDKAFAYWDKDKGEKVAITLPEEIIVVAEGNSIGGYVEAFKTGVRSNEIFNFQDPLVVRKNDGTVWIKGKWADIKEEIKAKGAKLQKHIHYTTPDSLELKTLIISGAGVTEWINNMNQNKNLHPATNRVILEKVGEGKVGRNQFSFPVFSDGKPLDQNDKNLQKAMVNGLQQHYEEAKNEVIQEVEKKEDPIELPFN